jgi:hypothetical protein
MPKDKEFTTQRNEGEGNRTAAREYNQGLERSIRSGQVDQKARNAEQDLCDDDIRRELEQAEAIGRRHIAEEDPAIRRSDKKD